MTCQCSSCVLGRKIDAALNSGTREELAGLVATLHNNLMHAQGDLGHLRAILDGSWPSSVERLSAALSVAVVKRRNAAVR